MPLEGTVKDMRSTVRKRVGKEMITTRRAEGVLAAESATHEERDVVVRTFVERRAKSKWEKFKGKGKGKADR
jgi:hypothetical protein